MSLTENLAASTGSSGWSLSFNLSSEISNLTHPTCRLVVVLAFLGLATLLSWNIWTQWRDEQVEIYLDTGMDQAFIPAFREMLKECSFHATFEDKKNYDAGECDFDQLLNLAV